MRLTIISDVKNNQQKFWNGKIFGTDIKVHTIYEYIMTFANSMTIDYLTIISVCHGMIKIFPFQYCCIHFFQKTVLHLFVTLEGLDQITLFVSTNFFPAIKRQFWSVEIKTNLSSKDKIFLRLAVSQRIIIISYSL